MPVMLRNAKLDKQLDKEGKRRGGISKTAAAVILITERLSQINGASAQPAQEHSNETPAIQPQ